MGVYMDDGRELEVPEGWLPWSARMHSQTEAGSFEDFEYCAVGFGCQGLLGLMAI
jgi:hypothetical protein